jgi:hypothetical protein
VNARRHLIPPLLAVALVSLAAAPAMAAPPPANDESGGAITLQLGDRVSQDTTLATTNAGDDTLNTNCGAPATNASVWYKYTPVTTGNVVLDTTQSNYSAGVMVFQGTPTADSLIGCGPGTVGLHAHGGTTYYIMAFSDTDTNGGTLVMTLKNAPRPSVHVTLAKHGVAFHKGGAAKIHGTYSCTHADEFAGVSAHLRQRAGRVKIQADSGTNIRCNGKRHRWTAKLVSPGGTYAKGRAVAKVAIISCGILQCRQAKTQGHLQLAWASGPQRQWMKQPTSAHMAHAHPSLRLHSAWPKS